jgi:integrase
VARKRGNGEGGISRRKDGRWEARYYADTPDGRRRKTLYGKTRKEVEEKLAKAVAAQEEPQAFVPTNIMVDEFFMQYEDAVKDTMKRRSLETYQDIARLHLLPAFGHVKLKNLTREQVQRLSPASGTRGFRLRGYGGYMASCRLR